MRWRATARFVPVLTITQPSNCFSRYGAFSGTLVVPAADRERAARLGELAAAREPERVRLALGSGGSPDTSSRHRPVSRRVRRIRAIEAVAPESPVIAIVCTGPSGSSRPPIAYPTPNSTQRGERDRSDRGVAPAREGMTRRVRLGPARLLESRRQLGRRPRRRGAGRGPLRSRSRSGIVAVDDLVEVGGMVAHSSPSSASASRASPLRVRVLTVPSGTCEKVCDLTLGESRRSTRGRSPPARCSGSVSSAR